MDAVEGVAPEVMGKFSRLADPRDHEEAFGLISNSARACLKAWSMAKLPQPGHQAAGRP